MKKIFAFITIITSAFIANAQQPLFQYFTEQGNAYSSFPKGGNKFWVTDPTNQNQIPFLKNKTFFGFNELDRRRTDLCNLINQPCTKSGIVSTTGIVLSGFEPKPKM
jgi:hypothetical protein